MKRLSLFCVAFWFAGAALRAQSSPELREILDRLQKLEESNRSLTDEVHSLRQELAVARSAPAPAPATERAEEQAQVATARVEEMAQSKVESSQKLPITITGMALFNTYVNGRYNGGTENTTIAPLASGDATGGGTLRQSIFGLLYNSPQSVLGAKVTGSVSLDLFGGSAASLNHLLRLRTATISLDWSQTSIQFGQDKPIISPRDPNSYAQVGVSPLTGAGNLWLWQPQVRLEQRFRFTNNFGVRAQVGVVQTREPGAESTGYNSYVPAPVVQGSIPVEHAQPGVEGRFEVWRQFGENARIEIAPGFHENASTVGSSNVDSHLFSIDWLIKPVKYVEFTGFFYNGQNIANLGALPQGFIPIYQGERAVPSIGGWAQLRFPVTERLAFDLYSGRQDDRNSDLRAGYIGLNQSFAANVMYRIASNVMLSFEASQLRTTYLTVGNRLNNHFDLAVAYLF